MMSPGSMMVTQLRQRLQDLPLHGLGQSKPNLAQLQLTEQMDRTHSASFAARDTTFRMTHRFPARLFFATLRSAPIMHSTRRTGIDTCDVNLRASTWCVYS